jgi:hypothetical protein
MMEKWIEFYAPFFASDEEAAAFVNSYEQLKPESALHRAKIMMHQVQRMVTLADDMAKLRPGRESLQLLFLMACAENISKIFHGYNKEGQSRHFIDKFFKQFLSHEDKEILELSFLTSEQEPMSLHQVIGCLYSVRCDVVHEGQYWSFNFGEPGNPIFNVKPTVTVNLTLSEFRAIVVRSAIRAVISYAP